MKVAFLGPYGTYSNQAAIQSVENATPIPVNTIEQVFDAVENHQTDYGIVPLENSTIGFINNTLDRFQSSNLFIIKEFNLPINHILISKSPLQEIQVIYSHQAALKQCSKYLEKLNIKTEEVNSTALGAKIASENPLAAAICSHFTISTMKENFSFLEENIQNNPENYTRFILLARKPFSQNTKYMYLLKSLSLLRHFNENKFINITSRPLPGHIWKYVWFVETEEEKGQELSENIQYLGSC